MPPASPMVNANAARHARRTRNRRNRGRKVAPAARASTAPAGARRARIGEELDEADDARLMRDILHQSYMTYIRPRMPITYLKGTSMMKHDPAPDLRPHWCHPEKTVKPRTPLWNRPVTPAKPLPSPATLDAMRERERQAQLQAAHKASEGAKAAAAAGAGSGRSGGSSRQWSQRSGSAGGHRTVRNGTSLNMPSFKRLPPGHPQSILYSALFPHMPISHIQRPGSPEATSNVWKHTRKRNQHVRCVCAVAGFDLADEYCGCIAAGSPPFCHSVPPSCCCAAIRCRSRKMRAQCGLTTVGVRCTCLPLAHPRLQVPTATLRAGFQPKYKQVLMPFEPQDQTTFTSSMKQLHTRDEYEEHPQHTSDVDREFRRTKGLFTDYMRDAIMKKVDYHKVGH